jgi:hypothetical protein
MPAQDRVRRHDRCYSVQEPSTQPIPLCRKPAPLVVRQLKTLPLQLLSENLVLLDEVLDDFLLVAVNPSSERQKQ